MPSNICLSDVCRTSVAYIGPKSRTERPRKTKIGTEVAHVTRDSDNTFKVKRLKVLVADVLNSQHAGTGATCRINRKKLSTCRGRRHIVSHKLFDFMSKVAFVGWATGRTSGLWKNWMLVCWWWWFNWSFARRIAPVVTTASIIICCNKHRLIQVHLENGH